MTILSTRNAAAVAITSEDTPIVETDVNPPCPARALCTLTLQLDCNAPAAVDVNLAMKLIVDGAYEIIFAEDFQGLGSAASAARTYTALTGWLLPGAHTLVWSAQGSSDGTFSVQAGKASFVMQLTG